MKEGKLSKKQSNYPVFMMCGRDPIRRRVMQVLDPDEQYPVKALLPFLGKRIIDWQLEALHASPYVGEIYLLGLDEATASFDLPVHYVPTDMVSDFPDKLSRGLAYLDQAGFEAPIIVISSSDAPGVRQTQVDEFLKELDSFHDYDFVLSVVPEELAESAFPRSGRAVARFTDYQVFPGELYALSRRAIERGRGIISEINKRRRMINRQVQNISLGPVVWMIARQPRTWPLLLKYVLGRAQLSDAERVVSLAFKCKAKCILIEDAGFGMDIDLPEDYARLEQYMLPFVQSHT